MIYLQLIKRIISENFSQPLRKSRGERTHPSLPYFILTYAHCAKSGFGIFFTHPAQCLLRIKIKEMVQKLLIYFHGSLWPLSVWFSSITEISLKDQEKTLTTALADILWTAGESQRATICFITDDTYITANIEYEVDHFTEQVRYFKDLERRNILVEIFLTQCKKHSKVHKLNKYLEWMPPIQSQNFKNLSSPWLIIIHLANIQTYNGT